MYDYKLNKNEEVELISDEGLLKKGNELCEVSIIVTNERLLILELPTDLERFRFGRTINYPIKKEVIFETPISEITKVTREKEYDKYLLKNTNYFYLVDNKIYNWFKSNKNN